MRALVSLAVASLALAGCLTQSQPEPLTGTDAPSLAPPAPMLASGAPAAFNTSACEDHVGWIPLPMSLAQQGLPEGFTLVPYDPAGLTATLLTIAVRCEATEGQGLDAATMHIDVAGFAVEAPEAFARDDAGFTVLLFGVLADREDVRATFEAWGVQNAILAEEIRLETNDAGPVRVGRAHSAGGGMSFDLETIIENPTTDEAGASRWISARDGQVTGLFDWDWNEANFGAGQAVLLSMEPGGPGVLVGRGIHSWGEDYGYAMRYVPLPASEAPAASAAELAEAPVLAPASGSS